MSSLYINFPHNHKFYLPNYLSRIQQQSNVEQQNAPQRFYRSLHGTLKTTVVLSPSPGSTCSRCIDRGSQQWCTRVRCVSENGGGVGGRVASLMMYRPARQEGASGGKRGGKWEPGIRWYALWNAVSLLFPIRFTASPAAPPPPRAQRDSKATSFSLWLRTIDRVASSDFLGGPGDFEESTTKRSRYKNREASERNALEPYSFLPSGELALKYFFELVLSYVPGTMPPGPFWTEPHTIIALRSFYRFYSEHRGIRLTPSLFSDGLTMRELGKLLGAGYIWDCMAKLLIIC